MLDKYFGELDAMRREAILDSLTASSELLHPSKPDGQQPGTDEQQPTPDGQEDALSDQELTQLRTLFSLRYEPNKKGGYNDRFIRALTILLDVANNPGGKMREKKNVSQVTEAVQTLCLDREEEFSETLLYRELCNLITLYIWICGEDAQYQSVFLSMGRMSRDKLNEKIRKDLDLLWEPIPAYLGEKDEYLLFKNAIGDIALQKLGP